MRPLPMLVLGCALLAGCGHESNPNTPSPSPVNQSVTLSVGQSVAINSTLTLRFREVLRDSRCPAAAICITAGEAVLAFDVVVSGSEAKHELKSDGPGKTLTLADYFIVLELLTPYPITIDPIPASDYRVTVRVTSR